MRLGLIELNSEPFTRLVWNDNSRLHVLLPLLVNLAPGHLVPNTSNVRCSLSFWLSHHSRNAHLHAITSRHLFTVKAIVAPTAGIVFFIWCIVKAKGVGPIISQPATVHGSELGWAMIVSLMSCISNMVTLIVQVLLHTNRDWETRLTNVSETGMPRILHLEQRRHPLRFSPSSSRSRSRFRSSASWALLLARPAWRFTGRQFGLPLIYWICSWMGSHPMRRDSGCVCHSSIERSCRNDDSLFRYGSSQRHS